MKYMSIRMGNGMMIHCVSEVGGGGGGGLYHVFKGFRRCLFMKFSEGGVHS